MIPKILHYVWVGGPLPQAQQGFIDSWAATNPDFKIMRWDEAKIDMSPRIIRDAYAQKKWAKVADIARLQAVVQYGGIYLDTDFRVLKPLDKMLAYKCFYAFQEEDSNSSDLVCNGVFGAEPNHWFIKRALDGLYAMKPSHFLPERPTKFGPKHITRLLRMEGLTGYSKDGVMVRDIFIAPVPWFFPFHYTEEFTPECVKPDTLAAHFWAKSWETSVPKPVRAAKYLLKGSAQMVRSLRGRGA